MSAFTYNSAKLSLGKGEIDWLNDTIKVRLLDDTYTPDQDNHTYLSDTTGAVGTDQTLSSKTATQDDTNDRAVFDAADVQYTGLTDTFRYAVVYQDTGNAATSRLIRCMNLEGENVSLTTGTYDITWSVGGVFNIQ